MAASSITNKKIIRACVAKPGLDGHDRGAKVLARALKDAGMEVIYTGIRQTPEQIVETCIQEDVDCLLLSLLSGAHNHLFPRITSLLNQKGRKDILVLGGGVIPDEDDNFLMQNGIDRVFHTGVTTEEIISHIKAKLGQE
ncbi:MAG: cobalamin B12-binding domain-containing protein [Candidatus Wallbacteria bacterium]|nr:cobalamin B12-binding domain-containing protein [Candidatus Wallbacteria bacterium]